MPNDAEWIRKELGRELAKRRHAAGLTQTEFALLTGRYSRATVSHAETGWNSISRRFWETCDQLLGTGSFFADSYDLLRDDGPAARTAVKVADHHLQTDPAMKSRLPKQAARVTGPAGQQQHPFAQQRDELAG